MVVDTSALIAVVKADPGHEAIRDCLKVAHGAAMSAATWTECLIVAQERNVADLLREIVGQTPIEIVPHDAALADLAAEAHRAWGKGNHPAALTIGDCFAYALARARDLPLLYVGADFAKTDVRSALG
ncbi:MAG: type II toxin-antitoxin system VapC family toxin [Paracoccaceae bacterium]